VIPAIDPGVGLKEERPATRMPQSESPAFARALRSATDPERPATERSVEHDRPSSDQRARRRYGETSRDAERARDRDPTRPTHKAEGKAADKADRTDGKSADRSADKTQDDKDKTKGQQADKDGSGKDLRAAAQQAGNPALQAADTPKEPLQDAAQQPGIAGLVLKDKTPGHKFNVPDDATPITAQIGAAAYRMGAHGKGEAAQAEANGVVLPGSVQDQLMGEGIHDAKLATMKKVEEPVVQVKTQAPFAALADAVQPSQASKADKPNGLSYKEQIALQTAQARNEVLSRLAAGGLMGDGSASDKGLSQGGSDSLRQQMQLHGLLARDARLHTLQPTSPNAPQTQVTGMGMPVNSVTLTQLHEAPHDDAVQQHVIDRVATEARWMITNNRQEVSLRLSPEHLGNLHMKVEHENGIFHIHLTVDNTAAKHLLESNLQDLRGRLVGDHPGGQFTFNVDVRQGHEQPSLYARANHTAPGGIGGVAAALDQAPAPGLAGRVLGQSGLSIYV